MGSMNVLFTKNFLRLTKYSESKLSYHLLIKASNYIKNYIIKLTVTFISMVDINQILKISENT